MRKYLVALLLSSLASPALAHVGHGETSAFSAGLIHPYSGLDHVLAMASVGLWAGWRGGKAAWLWPVSFVAALVVGGALGMAGFELPLVEQGILASVLGLALALMLALRVPTGLGMALIAVAGLLHGFAHGAEAPSTGGGALYAAGFVLASACLHGLGLLAAIRLHKAWLVRVAGAMVMAGGAYLLVSGG